MPNDIDRNENEHEKTRYLPALALCFSALPASAAVIAESSAGGTHLTAQLIPGAAFTLPVPATVFALPGYLTATIEGHGTGREIDDPSDVDFYKFFTSAAGFAYFDIDDPFSFDTIVSLFDSTGTLLGFDDDSRPADLGSSSFTQSFLGVISLPTAGAYYVAVTRFNNFPIASNSCISAIVLDRPDDKFGGLACGSAPVGDASFAQNGPEGSSAPYTLQLSVENIQAVPEPATLTLLGLGLFGIFAARRRTA